SDKVSDEYTEVLAESGGRKRILAVDDEEEILRLYESFLSLGGYEVVTATSAEECMRHLKEEAAPDMLLLDVNMPGIDGLKLLEFVRGSQRLAGMRVLMISAKRDEVTVRRAVELGCDGFLVKPFDLKELERRISLELF